MTRSAALAAMACIAWCGAPAAAMCQTRTAPALEWSTALEGFLIDSARPNRLPAWTDLDRLEWPVRWFSARPTPTAEAGRFERKATVLMANNGNRFLFGNRNGALDPARPQVHTITFTGNSRSFDEVSFSLESLTMASEALFEHDVLKRAGATATDLRCGMDELGLAYLKLAAFDWPGRQRAWYGTMNQGGSGGLSGDVTFYLADPTTIYASRIPQTHCG